MSSARRITQRNTQRNIFSFLPPLPNILSRRRTQRRQSPTPLPNTPPPQSQRIILPPIETAAAAQPMFESPEDYEIYFQRLKTLIPNFFPEGSIRSSADGTYKVPIQDGVRYIDGGIRDERGEYMVYPAQIVHTRFPTSQQDIDAYKARLLREAQAPRVPINPEDDEIYRQYLMSHFPDYFMEDIDEDEPGTIRNPDGSYSVLRYPDPNHQYGPQAITNRPGPYVLYPASVMREYYNIAPVFLLAFERDLERIEDEINEEELVSPPFISQLLDDVKKRKIYRKHRLIRKHFITEKELNKYLENTQTNIAMDVHNKSKRIDIQKIDQIFIEYFEENINPELEEAIQILESKTSGLDKQNFLLDNILFKKMSGFITEDKKEKLRAIIKKVKNSEGAETENHLFLTRALFFMFQQPEPIIKKYINTFIKSSMTAYTTGATELENMSCAKGIVERIYLLIPDVLFIMDADNELYKEIIDAFSLKIDKGEIFKEWLERWEVDNEKLEIYKTLGPTYRKIDYANFMIYKYMLVFGRELYPNHKKEIKDEINNQYLYENTFQQDVPQFGGRRKRRRRTQKKRHHYRRRQKTSKRRT